MKEKTDITEDSTALVEIELYELLRPEIRLIAHQMERKFQLHVDRGDPFQPYSWRFLLHREEEEGIKFLKAMNENRIPSEVLEAAADKMNIILMQAIKYGKEWKPKKQTGGR